MQIERSRVCVVGTGYIGVATAIGLAMFGHDVTGYDVNADRVHRLSLGTPPYEEADLVAALRVQLEAGRLRFTDLLAPAVSGVDFIAICVGTPSQPDGSADLSSLKAALTALAELPIGGSTIILRSTVPCGTTDAIADGLSGVTGVVYAPEFLREGHALHDFLNPDRIVVGVRDHGDAENFASLFAAMGKSVIATSYRDAELIKAFSNTFLAMKISFANEVAAFCETAGADALTVLAGVGADDRIGPRFLAPGIGFGGPCFEKDLKSIQYQASALGAPAELVSATLSVNEEQPKRIVAMLQGQLGTLRDRHIAVWGLTFKAGTDDVRDSIAIRIVEDLRRRGARVTAHDPTVKDVHPMVACEIVGAPLDALRGADALLVLTEWPAFASIEAKDIALNLRGNVVIDGRNVLDGAALTAAGLSYSSVGRVRHGPSSRRVTADAAAVVSL